MGCLHTGERAVEFDCALVDSVTAFWHGIGPCFPPGLRQAMPWDCRQ